MFVGVQFLHMKIIFKHFVYCIDDASLWKNKSVCDNLWHLFNGRVMDTCCLFNSVKTKTMQFTEYEIELSEDSKRL